MFHVRMTFSNIFIMCFSINCQLCSVEVAANRSKIRNPACRDHYSSVATIYSALRLDAVLYLIYIKRQYSCASVTCEA